MASVTVVNERLPTEEQEVAIPRVIMQTWKTHKVPEGWQPSVDSIQRHMPDWTYVLMDDEDNRNFVAEHFPDFLPYYDAFPYAIQRADAIRPCWLYVNGGIYMDLDLELIHGLSSLFRDDCTAYFVASGNVSHTITNSFMASKPRNPLWLRYIDEMKKPPPTWALTKHWVVMTTTGPLALTRVLHEWEGVYGMLPGNLVMPCSACNIQCDVSRAYIRPLVGQSWNAWDSHFYNWLMCNWRNTLVLLAILLALGLGFFLYYRLRR